MKTEENKSELYRKYLEDRCSPEELAELIELFGSPEDQAWLRKKVNAEINRPDVLLNRPEAVNRIVAGSDRRISVHLAERKSVIRSLRIWGSIAAAIVVMILSFGLYTYLGRRPVSDTGRPVVSLGNDIRPGGNKAVLTLAGGKQVVLTGLDNGEVLKQAGLKVLKQADGQLNYVVDTLSQHSSAEVVYHMISTPRGGQYQVSLPDGSRVWLNAGSAIRFPTNLARASRRKVEITGEAYFEVAHDQKRPFIVSLDGMAGRALQEIEVLGTHFNVNAYPDEPAWKTTLLEGSVRVSVLAAGGGAAKRTAVLKPGEQSALTGSGLKIKQVNPEQFIAWKNNKFIFDGDNIESITRQLSRWYDVEFVFRGKVSEENFGGKISRFRNLSEVLDLVELTGLVHFKIEGRRVIVMP
ncbi:FecR family protein [Pedobacter deserti]|uniref:FecR family protein n=1 Tax=Pedobacter deserti TaxID=2817382 RepID=UPI0021088DB0|nr:FecR family protein [Pedobacter sp. SYSU D00382]